MKLTVVRSANLEGLYVDGILAKQAYAIDIDDILMAAGHEKFSLTRKYLDENWLTLNYYTLPLFEVNIVELDS